LPHQKSANHPYFRLKFNPKSNILLSAMLFALCLPRGIRPADLPKVRFHRGAMRYTFILLFLVLCTLIPAAHAAEVTLGWDSNPEPDLEGYVIHRNVGYPGPPYDYSDTMPEDDLADPLHPKATLTELREGNTYYIALTAYNTDGVESRFSNNVCVEVVNGVIEDCTASLAANSVSGNGSGGGYSYYNGACFISASSGESSMFSKFTVGPDAPGRIVAAMFLLMIFITAVKLKKHKEMMSVVGGSLSVAKK
jgi:hypothetical protein